MTEEKRGSARGLKGLFNGSLLRTRAAGKAALQAIAGHDAEGVRRALEPLPADALSKSARSRLLIAAIEAKDSKTFEQVCALAGGPNTVLSTAQSQRGHFCINSYDPLHYALHTEGAGDIAFSLAGNPENRISPFLVGEAKALGSADVAAVLTRRLLDEQRDALAQLEAEAKAREPATPPAKKPGLQL